MHLTSQHGPDPARPPATAAPWWRRSAAPPVVLGYLALYLATAHLEHLAAAPGGLAPWSPRPALSVVLLLLLGLRYAALPLAAELAAGLLLHRPWAGPGAGWLLLDAALAALAWAAAAGLLGRLRLDPALRRPRDLGRLLLVAAAAAPLAAALPRAALAAATGLVPWAGAAAALVSWWARDAAGVALVAPLLAALVVRRLRPSGEPPWRPARRPAETAVQVLAVALPPLLGLWLPAVLRTPLLAAYFAPLAWAALRRGLAGASLAAAAAGLLLAGTLALRPPADAAAAAAELQSFLLVAAAAALWIGALADARGAGEAERGQLHAVLESSPDCVATVDRAGRLLYLNQAGRRLLGLGLLEPLGGRRLDELLPQLAARLSAQADLGPARWTGATTLHRGGQRVPLEHVAVAHPSPGGRTGTLTAITRDVSEARRVEDELAAAGERLDEQRLHLNAVTAHMPVALLVAKVDGTCLRAEGRALARLCARPESLVGASLFQALEAHDQLVGDFCQAATGSAVSSWATVGEAVLETHFRPVVGRNGTVKQVVGLLGDVTERVCAEAAAADLQARLDALQARMDSLEQGGTVRTLTAWLRHLEILEEELAGASQVTTLAPVKQTLERVLEAGADPPELPLPARPHTAPAGGVTAARPRTADRRPGADLVLTGEPAAPHGAGERAALPEPDAERR
jgi:PAS domain S-box-containing protein